MRKIYLALVALVGFSSLAIAQNETLTVTAYYPAPYGAYTFLRLYPVVGNPPQSGASCATVGPGAMYYDQEEHDVLYCNGGTWQRLFIGTSWQFVLKGFNAFRDYFYSADSPPSPLRPWHIGIGTSNPEFKLTLDNDGGIFIRHQTHSGGISTTNAYTSEGDGERLIWYGSSFRAGRGCNNEWETLGGTIALGYCANAGQGSSVAIGPNSKTISGSGQYSVAIGSGAVASAADYALALGTEVIAGRAPTGAQYERAIGHWAEAQADNSMVIGTGTAVLTKLVNNVSSSLMVGFNSTTPAFIVGPAGGGFSGSVGIRMNTPPDPATWAFYVSGPAGNPTGVWGTSDERLKKNIKPIPHALAKVMKLRGVNFEWKDPVNYAPGLQMGIVAQEAKDIIPEVVSKRGEYYYTQYGPIYALLIEAVKEQQKEIEELKAQLKIKIQQKARAKLAGAKL